MARWSSAWQSLRIAACTCGVASNPAGNATLSITVAVLKAPESGIEPFMPTAGFLFDSDYNSSLINGKEEYTIRVVLDFTHILVSTAMGCLSFLGVVLVLFLVLFAWSRGKGKHRGSVDISTFPRESGRKAQNSELTENKWAQTSQHEDDLNFYMAEDFTGCMVAYACLLDFVSLWVYVLAKDANRCI